MSELPLKCQCGKVQGYAKNVTETSGVRLVCHCDDCQSFANYLDSNSNKDLSILDENGGTEIFQIPLAHLVIQQGLEYLRCIKLKPKGMIRWYTDCCKTPIGNTISGKMAFIGVIHNFIDSADKRDEILGPVKSYLQTNDATNKVTSQPNHGKYPFGLSMKIMSNLLIWKIKGLNKPSALFDSNCEPISVPKILSE